MQFSALALRRKRTPTSAIAVLMPFLLSVLILLLLIAFPSAAPAQDTSTRPIRVIMDDNYPPYVFRDDNGGLKGILIDQWRLWERKTGIAVELNALDWAEAQRRMQAGEYDVIDTIFRNGKREKIYDFTKPYARLEVPLYFRTEISGISQINDLQGFAVGVKAGGNVIDVLRARGITNLIEFNSYEAIVTAAKNRKINVFTVEKIPGQYFLYKFGINKEFHQTKPLYTGEFHRAVAKGNKALLETIENGFGRITQEEYEEIEKRWYGAPILDSEQLRHLRVGGAAAIALLCGLGLWLYVLRRVVAKRTAELSDTIRELNYRKKLMNYVINGTTDAIFVKDSEGRYILVNKTVERVLGHPAEDIFGKDDRTFFPPDEARLLMERDRQIMESNEPVMYEERVTTREGLRTFLATKGSIRDDQGQIVGLFGISRDVTERKLIEELLVKNEARYRELVEGTSDLVTQVDATGRFLYVNHNAEAFFGDCIGKEFFDMVHSDDRDMTRAAYTEWVERGICSTTLENRCISRAGKVHDLLWTITFHYADGRLQQINSIARDMTEQRALQNEQLKSQKLESLGVLAGGIAHDFNNLLTAIVGNISLIHLHLDDKNRATELLTQAEQASERASNLAQQLLTFAKGSQPVKRLVRAREIVEASAALVLSGSTVLSVIELPEELHDLEVDEGQISQVFNNLLINAKQAMPAGGTIRITAENTMLGEANFQALPPGCYVRFSVADTGCGIPDDLQGNIFDPYFTTKELGNGLGLASAHSIIAKHGGHISVSSTVGVGTTFQILLPASSRKAEKKDAPTAIPAPAPASGRSILLMDDEEMIRRVAVVMFEQLGYGMETCTDGEEAIALYREAACAGNPYAAVIMDLTIPGGMGGKDAAQKILEIDENACLIVSSGYSQDPIMAELDRYGFRAALVKPYKLAEVVQIMNGLLHQDTP